VPRRIVFYTVLCFDFQPETGLLGIVPMRLPCLTAILLVPLCLRGEDPPPSITYPNTRVSRQWIDVNGVNLPVDDGIEWQGVKVYLSDSTLIGVDTKGASGGKTALWSAETSAFWNTLKIVEVEAQKDKKVWAVEMRARTEDDPLQKAVEYRELKTGKKIELPASRPTGVSLMPVRSLGTRCSVATPFFALVTTQENFEKVWQRLNGPSDPIVREEFSEPRPPQAGEGLLERERKPTVDFSKDVVLVYCIGDSANSSGISAEECYQDEKRILLRTQLHGFQTTGSWVFTRECSLFALPRLDGVAYVLEHNRQNYIGGPPMWTEMFRVAKIGDTSCELDAMPPVSQAKALPADFAREIKHFKTPDIGKDDFGDFWGKFEFDYYDDPSDGKKIRHGPFRKYRRDGEKEKTEFKGAYEHGRKHGLWTYYVQRFQDWDDKTPYYTETYERGELHGPVRIFDPAGKLVRAGQYEHGKAQGMWVGFHDNGMKSSEQTYDHDLLHGVSSTWNKNGRKLTEVHYVKGQFHGPYTRWHPDGYVAEKGRFVAGEAPPELVDSTGSRLYSCNHNALRGYRDGEWTRYGSDGKELWRGRFERGTGTWVNYDDEGRKTFEARLVRGVIDGECRTWNKQGGLEKLETIVPGGESVRMTFHANGVKESETRWRGGRPDGLQSHWDVDGKLEAEGEWRDGKPWSGDCMQLYEGIIRAYAEGKRVDGKKSRWTRKVAEEVAERERQEKEDRKKR
jgi:antitoxin component YwqK of YwqJK toxin-antitoxin module